MKNTFGICLLLLVTLTSRADFTNTFSSTPNVLVPDGSAVGLTSTLNVSGTLGNTTNLTVALNITGGFNGDLYAYLVSPTSSLVVLLNRVGMSSTNNFGYGTAGFSITLDSSAANNVHFYQNYSPTITGGQLTGPWTPDGRTLDPVYSSSQRL